MQEYLLTKDDSVVYAAELLYNYLDCDFIIENDVFYFSPYSEDESMPSLWIKPDNIQVYWYRDNPARGASCNYPSTAELAFKILDAVRCYYGRKQNL